MRLLTLLLVPLALYGSGCSLPVGAEPLPAAHASPSAASLPDFIGQDAIQAAVALRDAGLQYRLYPSARGQEGVVMNQLPKPGQQLQPGATVDLVVGGDERVMDMVKLAAQPPAPEPEDPVKREADQLEAIRSKFGDKYELSEEALSKIELPSIEGLHGEHVQPAPMPEPSPVPKTVTTAPFPGPAGMPTRVDTPTSEQSTGQSKTEPSGAETPTVAVSAEEPLSGPSNANLGAWSVTLPGPTKPVEYTVQGEVASGVATRSADGKTIFSVCTTKANSRGESLPAGVIDQILMAAPFRYGKPQRSGRYTSAHMPAVSSIITTGQGSMRVVTWYGYGQLCDVGVPVDAQGRSDQVLDPILSSLRPN